MSFYLSLNIFIISIPLLLSFESRVRYVKRWPAVFFSILTVGVLYIVWDMVATANGHWAFNPRYVGHLRIFNLPVEEILFFITTPFSCLFVYEVINYFKKDKIITFKENRVYGVILFFLGMALACYAQAYTALAFIATAGFFFIAVKFFPNILFSLNFWRYILICYIPFVIFNGILTGIPVVQYNPQFIGGLRIISIPLEDFVYNFSYLGFTLLAYKFILRKAR
ncbi:MAG: lycopene cyclase domain-containing protein [Candidatus Aceula meridiana]|nr:lycopene cyclase domain-containing protein [Candidatus Aceula meridiana]